MKLREVNIVVSNKRTGETYLARSFPCSDRNHNGKQELYEVPVYYVYIKGVDENGISVTKTWKALRFMPYYKPRNFPAPYRTVGWADSGLRQLGRRTSPRYNRHYQVHNTYSEYNGAIVLRDSFYIHAGPERLAHEGWGAAGCVEVIGNFGNFKADIYKLSGSIDFDIERTLETLVEQKKLFVEVEPAMAPSLKSKFKKEV